MAKRRNVRAVLVIALLLAAVAWVNMSRWPRTKTSNVVVQQTAGNCSPSIANFGGNVTVTGSGANCSGQGPVTIAGPKSSATKWLLEPGAVAWAAPESIRLDESRVVEAHVTRDATLVRLLGSDALGESLRWN
jgi:hypothetical protein